MTGLRSVGKPYRALCALRDHSSPDAPLDEGQVYRFARVEESDVFYSALERLVGLGYADRARHNGRWHWYITDAGREFLCGVDS